MKIKRVYKFNWSLPKTSLEEMSTATYTKIYSKTLSARLFFDNQAKVKTTKNVRKKYVNNTVSAESLEVAAGPKIDKALGETQNMLQEIRSRNFQQRQSGADTETGAVADIQQRNTTAFAHLKNCDQVFF